MRGFFNFYLYLAPNFLWFFEHQIATRLTRYQHGPILEMIETKNGPWFKDR